jgi:peptide/nickel transport system substrate-binding protein
MPTLCSRKRVLLMLFVLFSGMLIGLCGSVAAADDKKTLVIAITADPRNISPISASTFHDWVVGYRVYSSLFQADENFQPVPDLAESWEVSADQLTYTFHLKRNATFHDGSPVTAEDVAFSVMEVNLPHGSICGRGPKSVIESVETPDAHTVVFHLSKPFPEFLNPYDGLGPHCSGVLKKSLYAGTDLVTNPHNFKPVGSGPYKMVEWVRGSHIVLERYEEYHGPKPAPERIVFRIIGDAIARTLAFEKGEVQWIPFEAPASEVARLSKLPGNNVFFHGSPCGTIVELGFNLRQEPFNNLKVRKALTAAINKQKIINLVYFGGGELGIGHIPKTPFSAWWYNPNATQIAYDPKVAARMLDEAGYPVQADGWRFRFNLKHTTGYNEHIKIAELIKDDLKKVGVDVHIISLDHAAWHEHVFKNWDFDTSLLPFCGGPTPPTLKRFHTKNIQRISWANCMGWSNQEYDALFDQMLSETDKEKRLRMTNRMQEILIEEQPVVYIVHRLNATAIKADLVAEAPQDLWVLRYLWMHLDNVNFAK